MDALTKENTKESNKRRCTRHWTQAEHNLFVRGCIIYGWGKWIRIKDMIPTRDRNQVSSHAQGIGMRRPELKQALIQEHSIYKQGKKRKLLCSVKNCTSVVKRSGKCAAHAPKRTCSVFGCCKTVKKNGACNKHSLPLETGDEQLKSRDDDDNDASIPNDNAVATNLDNSQMSAIGGRTMEVNYDASDEDAAGSGAVDGGDDDANSVSSTKSYYRDLCIRLTFALENKNEMEKQLRIKNQRLEEEIAELSR